MAKHRKKRQTPKWFSDQQKRLNQIRKKLLCTRTAYERIFEDKLNALHIPFIAQKGFITAQRLYIADFYIPKHKVVIEIDGGYHKIPIQIWLDKKRDEFFSERKCETIRIDNENVRSFDVSIFK